MALVFLWLSYGQVLAEEEEESGDDGEYTKVTDPEELKKIDEIFKNSEGDKEDNSKEAEEYNQKLHDDYIASGKTEEEYEAMVKKKMKDGGVAGSAVGNIDFTEVYEFNESSLDFEAVKGEVYPGELIEFKGTVTNGMNVPIARGNVYAKVYREDSNEEMKNSNGDFRIDSFFLVDSFNLGPLEEKEYEGKWQVPHGILEGDYYLGLFFTSSKKYNLAGVNYYEDGFAKKVNFKIVNGNGGNDESAIFDKDNIKINDKKRSLRRFEESFAKVDEVVVKVPVINKSIGEKNVN